MTAVITSSSCLDQFCWDVVDSSQLPLLLWLYCNLHFFAKDGVVILCVCLETVQYSWISIGLVIIQLSTVFCPSVQYLSFFCEAFSWTILDSSSFSLFHSGQVFHELVCPLTVILPQIFFNHTTLFSYQVFFCLFHAPLEVVVHFLVFLRTFRFRHSWCVQQMERTETEAIWAWRIWEKKKYSIINQSPKIERHWWVANQHRQRRSTLSAKVQRFWLIRLFRELRRDQQVWKMCIRTTPTVSKPIGQWSQIRTIP